MRRFIFLLAFWLLTGSSWAQFRDVEIMAGPDFGTLRSNMFNRLTETESTFDSKMGYSLGVGSNYFFNDKFSIGARLLYQKTTVRGDFPFELEGTNGMYVGNLELTTSFNYISLPIMVKYTLGNKLKFSGEVGGFINCLLNSTASDYVQYDSQTPNYIDINSMISRFAEATGQYTRFDAGVSLGLSSQVPLSKKLGVKLSAYDNYGLVDISTTENPSIPIRQNETDYLRSNTINLLVGIVYQFL